MSQPSELEQTSLEGGSVNIRSTLLSASVGSTLKQSSFMSFI